VSGYCKIYHDNHIGSDLMYCVIQEVELKKENTYGEYKELTVNSTTITDYSTGETKTQYTYRRSGERFERPIKTAYKISIHQSYREGSKVKKKQWSICTISYYQIAEGWTWIGDYTNIKSKIQKIGITEDELCDVVYKKLDQLKEKVQKEFKESEEHTIKTSHEITIKEYLGRKSEFEKIYGSGTYDYCYDVFGELRNKDMLDNIKRQYESAKEYKRSYYENFKSNYSSNNYGSCSNKKQSTYSEEDKEKYKKLYKALAMKFHPDIAKDDGEMMKLVNKLKEDWGI